MKTSAQTRSRIDELYRCPMDGCTDKRGVRELACPRHMGYLVPSVLAQVEHARENWPGSEAFNDALARAYESMRIGESLHRNALMNRCVEFAIWAAREAWDGCDIDGGTIQDKLHSLGVLRISDDPPKSFVDEWGPDAEYYELVPEIRSFGMDFSRNQ